MDDILGIRATIDASEVQQGANDFVQQITNMKQQTDTVVLALNNSISSVLQQVSEFGRTANGMSLSELSNSLSEAKANFVSLSEDIAKQRQIISDTTFELRDLQQSYADAKSEGKNMVAQDLLQQIETYKQGIQGQRRELAEMVTAQQQAKESIQQLSQAYQEAKNSNPSFESVTQGAQTAEERMKALKDSFDAFQASVTLSQQGINELGAQGAQAQTQGDEGQATITKTIETRYTNEGAEETAEKTQLVKDKIDEVSTSYARSLAASQTAFNEQKNLIGSLEGQIANLQQVMMQATKAGDMDSATQAAKQIQVLEGQLTTAKSKLEEFQKSAEDAQKKLTDFANKTPEIEQRLENQSTAWGRLKDRFSMFGDRFGNWLRGDADKGKQAISQFTDIIDGMGLPLTKSIKGFSAMTKSAIGFIATPLGAVLAAIVFVLKSVYTYLNKSAEGQKILAKVSAFLGSIMQSVTDIVIAFGKYFFKVFTGANTITNEFTTNFVKTFKSAFSAVKNLTVGFGTIFKGVWQIITGEIKEGWTSITSGISQMGTGVKDSISSITNTIKTQISAAKLGAKIIYGLFSDKELSKDLSNAFGNIGKNAMAAAEGATENLKLSKEADEAKERGLQIDTKVNDLKNKARQTTGKEKDDLLKQAKILQQQKYYGRDILDQKTGQIKHENGIYDVQKKQYDNLKRINGLHVRNLSALKAERQARMGLAQTQAQSIASMSMLVRMEAANLRSMKAAEKSSAKKATADAKRKAKQDDKISSAEQKVYDTYDTNNQERTNAAVSVEEKIIKAKIAAMRDGYARTRAEREQQNEDELQQIEKQREAAIKAEKKRQRSEFDAIQALVKSKGGKAQKWDENTMVDSKAIDDINSRFDQLSIFTSQKQQRTDRDELSNEYDKQAAEKGNRINKLLNDIERIDELIKKSDNEADKAELNKLKSRVQAQLDWVRQSKDAWNDYVQKYGSFQEKVAAINEKFEHDTINLSDEDPLKMRLERERDAAIQTLEAAEKLKAFDWMSAFGNLSKLSSDTLERVKEQLKEILDTDNTLSVSDKSKLVDKYTKVQEQLDKNKTSWVGGAVGTLWNNNLEKKRLRQNYEEKKGIYDDAVLKNEEAQHNKKIADENLDNRRTNLNDYLKLQGSKMKADDLKGMDEQQALQVLQQSGVDTSKFGDSFGSLFKGFTGASDAAAQASAQASQAASAMQNAGQGLQGAEAEMGKSAVPTDAIIKGVNQNVQSLNELTKKYIGSNTQFAKGMEKFAESSQEATAAFDSLKSGDFFGVILHLSNAFESLAQSIGGFFGYDNGIAAWEKEVDHYNRLSGIWDDLISKKSEYVNMSFGNAAVKAIEQVESLYKSEETSAKKLMQTYLKIREIGHHSNSYKNNKAIRKAGGYDEWSRLAGVSITQAKDFYLRDYSYEELLALKGAKNGEFWGSMDKDMQSYLETLLECKKNTEDFQQTTLEKLTGIKFDDMYQNFMSALSDMSKGADDFVNDFKNNMLKALIENQMGNEVKKWTEDFVNRYQAAVKSDGGKISETHAQQFRQEISEASNNFFHKRQDLANSIGQGNAASSGEQKKGFATASEESIEELSGRALAQTEALYSIHEQQLLDTAKLDNVNNSMLMLISIETQRNNWYDESINIQKTSVTHLANIEKNTNELFVISERLQKIEKNTRNI